MSAELVHHLGYSRGGERPEGQSNGGTGHPLRESFTYDLNGDPLTHTDFNGKTTSYVYDTHHRETTRSYADGSRVVTTYTATGQIDTVTDGSGLTDYDYDTADRLTKVSYPTGQFIEYGYDATGNLVCPNGATTLFHERCSIRGELSGS